MALFLLIRHGDTDAIGQCIPGRMPGIHLNASGRRQVETLARNLASLPIDHIYSSPLERTRETAAPIAETAGLEVKILDEINEVDFGNWSGTTFADLEQDSAWIKYNRFRTGTRIPGGELFIEVQARMLREVDRIATEFPDSVVALVSHGDPIKSLIAPFLGIPHNYTRHFEISPASVSILSYSEDGARIFCLNRTETIPGLPVP